jgi:hypothetical protein
MVFEKFTEVMKLGGEMGFGLFSPNNSRIIPVSDSD